MPSEEPSLISSSATASPFDSDDDDDADDTATVTTGTSTQVPARPPRRRLSTYESPDQILSDLEENRIDNTGRKRLWGYSPLHGFSDCFVFFSSSLSFLARCSLHAPYTYYIQDTFHPTSRLDLALYDHFSRICYPSFAFLRFRL